MSDEQQHYKAILRTSSLIGGAAFINILIGMVRTKFVAVLLGPSGVGLMGMYNTLLGPISTATGMGLNTSGVRQIAEAHGSGDSGRISEVVTTLRRTVWGTGALGCVITVFLSPWLSEWSFKTREHAFPIAVLGLTILCGNIAVGQTCILQGTRRIGDLAKMQMASALNGALISIPCFYLWGIQGVLPCLLLTSLAGTATSWAFARRVHVDAVSVSLGESISEVRRLLVFGFPLMLNGLQGALVAFFIRLAINSQFGLSGVGVWEASYVISGVLVNFVLSAMGTDYYPRLTAIARDRKQISTEVNAQTEISVLLSMPALLATILFAPLGVELLYSGKFDASIPILRWSVLGALGKVVSWPLSFIILAQGRGALFLMTEMFTNLLYIVLVFVCSRLWGLQGTGVAFFLLYIGYTVLMLVVARLIASTCWTRSNICQIFVSSVVLTGGSLLHKVVSSAKIYYPIASVMFLVSLVVSLNLLARRTGMGINDLKRILRLA